MLEVEVTITRWRARCNTLEYELCTVLSVPRESLRFTSHQLYGSCYFYPIFTWINWYCVFSYKSALFFSPFYLLNKYALCNKFTYNVFFWTKKTTSYHSKLVQIFDLAVSWWKQKFLKKMMWWFFPFNFLYLNNPLFVSLAEIWA